MCVFYFMNLLSIFFDLNTVQGLCKEIKLNFYSTLRRIIIAQLMQVSDKWFLLCLMGVGLYPQKLASTLTSRAYQLGFQRKDTNKNSELLFSGEI